MFDLGTILLSETAVSFGGTFPWMSPELLDSQTGSDCPTRESDCYALGMVIYEVSRLNPSHVQSPVYPSQVLTGVRPFHRLRPLKSVLAVLGGERPEKPPNAESIGFSHTLWGLVQLCWSKSTSSRPTARHLLNHLSPASLTWAPPPVYPAIEINTGSDSSGSSGADSTGEVWNW